MQKNSRFFFLHAASDSCEFSVSACFVLLPLFTHLSVSLPCHSSLDWDPCWRAACALLPGRWQCGSEGDGEEGEDELCSGSECPLLSHGCQGKKMSGSGGQNLATRVTILDADSYHKTKQTSMFRFGVAHFNVYRCLTNACKANCLHPCLLSSRRRPPCLCWHIAAFPLASLVH